MGQILILLVFMILVLFCDQCVFSGNSLTMFLFYVYEYLAYICLCIACVCWYSQKPEEEARSPGTALKVGLSLHVGAGYWSKY